MTKTFIEETLDRYDTLTDETKIRETPNTLYNPEQYLESTYELDKTKIREFLSNTLNQLITNELPKILDTLWKNEELQEAISLYGEWNDTELNKAYNKAKQETITQLQITQE